MRFARTILAVAALAIGITTAQAASPDSVYGCSCVAPQPMAAYKGEPTSVIFVATIVAAARDRADAGVERWFQGPGDAIVRLDGFGDQSSACQSPVPPVGSRWIYVGYVPEGGGSIGISSCSPQGRLDTDEGAAMLLDAQQAFGQGTPAVPLPTDPPEAPPAAAPTEVVRDLGPIIAVGAVAVVALVMFGAAALLVRRRRDASGA